MLFCCEIRKKNCILATMKRTILNQTGAVEAVVEVAKEAGMEVAGAVGGVIRVAFNATMELGGTENVSR